VEADDGIEDLRCEAASGRRLIGRQGCVAAAESDDEADQQSNTVHEAALSRCGGNACVGAPLLH
jgi:hypothetical protein